MSKGIFFNSASPKRLEILSEMNPKNSCVNGPSANLRKVALGLYGAVIDSLSCVDSQRYVLCLDGSSWAFSVREV